ncbi:MAG TPA: type I phosphomannose isomerase catalytic subunit [Terracidiphilus sp.]|nr:type I phosphomannose isomerase catalytic subunit [Terracidiphilus sp.]
MDIDSQTAPSAWAPFRLTPWFAERVWGFRDLHPWYDWVAGDDKPIGEAWLTGDQCVVATGVRAGKTLGALFSEAPEFLLGKTAPCSAEAAVRCTSPLLIKVLFVKEKLSVQVHPDDALAQKFGEPCGKTECWYVLEAEPGAQVACGLKPGITLDDVKAGIETGTLESRLNMLNVASGEVIFIDAGTVHAIWPGSILLETQQNCDLTYRMYDYGRGRELHIEKALQATRLKTRSGKIPPRTLDERTILMEGYYFSVERIPVSGSRTSASLRGEAELASGLQYLFVAGGAARITGPGLEPLELPMGGIAAVPAASPQFEVEDSGGLNLIRITPRWPGTQR